MGNSCGNCNNPQEEKKEELIPQDTPKGSQKPEKNPVSKEVKQLTLTMKKVSYDKSKKSDDVLRNDFQQDDKPHLFNNTEKHFLKPQAKNTDINLNSLQKVFSEAFIPQVAGLNKTVMPLPYTEEEKLGDSHAPQTLYEKFGGAEGMHTYITKIIDKLLADPAFAPYFECTDVPLITEKFKQYMTYLTGGSQQWIGISMKEAHRKMHITDELFDKFVGHTVQVLKQMKVKIDCLKEAVVTINSLREQIVNKEESLPKQIVPQTIYDKLGQMEGINQVTEWLYNKIYNDEELSTFFKKTTMEQQKKRFAYFLAAACGGPFEWVGKNMKEAHKGRGIKDEHFMTVGTYLVMALNHYQVDKETQSKIFEQVYALKKDIVQPKILYERIIDTVPLQTLVDKFVNKIRQTKKLQKVFQFLDERNLYLFLANKTGQNIGSGNEVKPFISDTLIHNDDIEFAVFIFRQILLEEKLDNNTIEEVCQIFENIKDNIIMTLQEEDEEEEEIIKIEEVVVQEEEQQQQQQENSISIQLEENKDQNIDQQSNQQQSCNQKANLNDNMMTFHVIAEQQQLQIEPDIQQSEPGKHCQEDQNLQEEEQRQEAQPIQKEDQKQQEEQILLEDKSCQAVPSRHTSQNLQAQQHAAPLSQHSSKHSQKSLDIEIDKEVQLPESPISHHSTPRQKKSYPQFKYVLSELLCDIRNNTQKKDLPAKGSIIFQGELQRFMDKQKTQLPRWLILNAKALLIYKDQMHSKSFPYKPLYAIPLPEIQSITTKEIQLPNSRKSQALHSIEIELKDKYGYIAETIAQLVSSYLVHKEDPFSSPAKERTMKGGLKQNQQQHGYEDRFLAFVSSNKKDIFKWHKVISEQCKPRIEESQVEHIAIIEEIDKAQEETPDISQQISMNYA